MKEKKIKGWKRELVDLVADTTGCGIQYNGCPCNTCFHSKFCEDLDEDIAHLFWLVVLNARGDSTGNELITANKEFFTNLSKMKIK